MTYLISAASWNYDLANGSADSNTLDYLSVATHEIGHVLGFVSGCRPNRY